MSNAEHDNIDGKVAALELWRDKESQRLNQFQEAFERMGEFIEDVRKAAEKANALPPPEVH